MSVKTPVVLLFYRRPHLLQRVFDVVAAVRPTQLLLVADGPRDDAERGNCEAARAVVAQVAWPCEVRRLYAATNLGCKQRVSSGLNWVFDQVEEAIILEDDCLPDPSFFPFCESLLARFREDERVFGITGSNLQAGQRRSDASYHFSGYPGIWGWATWKRAWRHYDADIASWPRLRAERFLESLFDRRDEVRYWRYIFDQVYAGRIDTWDYQVNLTMWLQRALFIWPEVNLVSNIGFGDDATHPLSPEHPSAAVPLGSIGELTHPPAVRRHHEADRFSFTHTIRGPLPPLHQRVIGRLRRELARFGVLGGLS